MLPCPETRRYLQRVLQLQAATRRLPWKGKGLGTPVQTQVHQFLLIIDGLLAADISTRLQKELFPVYLQVFPMMLKMLPRGYVYCELQGSCQTLDIPLMHQIQHHARPVRGYPPMQSV